MVWLMRKPSCWWTFMMVRFPVLLAFFSGIPKYRNLDLLGHVGLSCFIRINTEQLSYSLGALSKKPSGFRGVGRMEILKYFFTMLFQYV